MREVVWITGASSGIGRSLALELSKRGHKLIISSRSKESLEKVKLECHNPDDVEVLPLDLEKYTDLKSKVDIAMTFFGSIDVLVNNGGISQRSLGSDTIIDVDKRIMDINYLGTVALTKAILPYFRERKSGYITTVTSMVGKFGTPMRSSYSASKHALHGFMDSLRAEVFNDGVSIGLVCPGFVATNVSLNALTSQGESQGTMDESTKNGIHPDKFAIRFADSIEKRSDEVYIAGLKELFGLYMSRYFPFIFRILIRKMKVT